jgi:murein DD-endopeptidase MepM/ murein hydrolase activator NlpD
MHRRRSGRLVAALTCLGVLLAFDLSASQLVVADDGASKPTPTAGASADPTTQQVIDHVRDDLAESSEAMVAAATSLKLAEAALPGARSTVAQTRLLLVAAQRRQAVAAQRRGEAQSRLMLADQDAEAGAAAVDEQTARVGRLARAVYQGGGSLTNAAMLLQSRSPADFAERLVAIQTVTSSQSATLADLRDAQQSFGDRASELAAVRSEMSEADRQAQAELAVISQLERQASAAATKVADLVKTRTAALAAGAAAQAEDDARTQALAGEGSSLQSTLGAEARRLLGAAGAKHGYDIAPVPGTLGRPVIGPITSPFGIRVHPITGVRKLHTGTDFGVPCGTPIKAALEGTVISAGYNTAYGWRTVVSHGVINGALLTTTYNHQTRLGVTVGQHVTAGEVIGISGTTGYSTGCHLHFELIVNADFVDPVPWLVR